MTTKRKVPLRRCVVTGEMLPKKSMLRVVRSKEGEVFVDKQEKNPAAEHMYQNRKKSLKLPVKKTF